MSFTRKIASGASAAAVAVACMLPAVAGVGTAHAAPATNKFTKCSIRGGANYPPGLCFLGFNKTKYHHGDDLKFKSGKDFIAHEQLKVVLTCKGGYKKQRKLVHGFSYHHVGAAGRAKGHFIITKHQPLGKCTVAIRGLASNSAVQGSFTVVKKPKK